MCGGGGGGADTVRVRGGVYIQVLTLSLCNISDKPTKNTFKNSNDFNTVSGKVAGRTEISE